MIPNSFSTMSWIGSTADLPWQQLHPLQPLSATTSILVLMHISGFRLSPVELVPLHGLLGHCKLRSEGRGRTHSVGARSHKLPVSPTVGVSIHLGFTHSLVPCLLTSLCGSGVWEDTISSSSFMMVCSQSPHPTTPLPGSLSRAHLPQMRPPWAPAQRLPAPCHLATAYPLQTAIRVEVSYVPGCFLQLVTETAPHGTSPPLLQVPHHLEQVFF